MKLKLFFVLALFAQMCSAQFVLEMKTPKAVVTERSGSSPLVEAYNAIMADFNKLKSYYQAALKAYNSGNFVAAKNYLNKCKSINAKYNGELCSNSSIQKAISACNSAINQQNRIKASLRQRAAAARNASLSSSEDDSYTYYSTDENTGCRIVGAGAYSTFTYVDFQYTNSNGSGGWCSIDPDAYIVDSSTGSRYKLVLADGIPVSPEKHTFSANGETLTFRLVFPPVSSSASYVDMVENATSSWKFYHIRVR